MFFVEWEIHVQVAPLDRPLPPGEGWGEGLPATSVGSISSHRLRGYRGATCLRGMVVNGYVKVAVYAPVAPTAPVAAMRMYSRRPLGMAKVRSPVCPAPTLIVFDVALPKVSNSVTVRGVSVAITCTFTVPL